MREAYAGCWKRTAGLLLLALILRLYFALACPFVAGDSSIYEAFAQNLLHSGTYSHLESTAGSLLRPTLIRVPGYPLFLAAVFNFAGMRNEIAVRIIQALLDTLTCLLIGLMVFEMSDREVKQRRRLAQWALFLSALCPFSANYAAAILTETPTTLLWTAGTLFGLRSLRGCAPKKNWLLCGLLAGAASLFRPESGLLPGVIGLVLVFKEGIRRQWKPILVGGSLMAAGLAIALFPWTARNALTLRTFQPLAPIYAQDQGERVVLGYLDWCKTWLWTYRDETLFWFPIESETLPAESLPAEAGDGNGQREKTLSLIRRYNNRNNDLDAALDSEFESIALERRHAHPFRYYFTLPFLRASALWFTPRVELLNLDGRLLPISQAWNIDPRDFSITLFFFILNIVYMGLALCGALKIIKRSGSFRDPEFLGCFTLLAIIAIRTIFFACFTFPEPRYVLEVYPNVIALGAFTFMKMRDSRVARNKRFRTFTNPMPMLP
jgi:4-amino-4-deoxy-L-arabinose transferase-like glycosyltransferase